MIAVTLNRPWLIARLPHPMRVLSWAPYGAGYRQTDTILWREVRNSDLSLDFDADSWTRDQVADAGHGPGVVVMLTSRDIGAWVARDVRVGGVSAACVVTAGLSNAESVGRRLPWHSADGTEVQGGSGEQAGYGTINMAVATDAALTEAAQLEALTIAVQARTAAVMEGGLQLATGLATGTGTDCVALACNTGAFNTGACATGADSAGAGRYAGLHTDVGEAIGAAVRAATSAAVTDWMRWRAVKRAEAAAG